MIVCLAAKWCAGFDVGMWPVSAGRRRGPIADNANSKMDFTRAKPLRLDPAHFFGPRQLRRRSNPAAATDQPGFATHFMMCSATTASRPASFVMTTCATYRRRSRSMERTV